MPEFLELLPPPEALALLLRVLREQPVHRQCETLETLAATGRVICSRVVSPEALPAFPRSTVDGYAVRAADSFGASDTLPAYLLVAGEVPMGGAPAFRLLPGQAALIHTGGMLPEGADAVVMLEYTQIARPGEIELLRAVASGENILKLGEDVAAGQEVLAAGTRIRPAVIGGLLALGICSVSVARKPRVGILSSGDEVIPPEQPPQPGQVRDINSYSLSALISENGGEAVRYGIVADQAAALEHTLVQALDACDMVVITAGSSASTRDLTAQVIAKVGKPGVLVHGVNVRPGKPTILAVCNGKPVIGLPGNPVSALVIAGLFVTPVIAYLLGLPPTPARQSIHARLKINLASQAGREDWVPVVLSQDENGWFAEPIFYKSNLIFTLARADGFVVIPADATGLAAGAAVAVLPV